MITGLRKFIFCLVVFGAACVFLWFGKLDAANFTSITIWVTGIFCGANVAASVGSKVAEKVSIEAKSTEVPK